jgi:hypothetical protein
VINRVTMSVSVTAVSVGGFDLSSMNTTGICIVTAQTTDRTQLRRCGVPNGQPMF